VSARQVEENDRVRLVETPWQAGGEVAVDDPPLAGQDPLQRGLPFVRRRRDPARFPVEGVQVIDGQIEERPQPAGKRRLAGRGGADDRYPLWAGDGFRLRVYSQG
jgi:hypothetical protein